MQTTDSFPAIIQHGEVYIRVTDIDTLYHSERIAELEKEVQHWKSNHDNQCKLKSAIMDRRSFKLTKI